MGISDHSWKCRYAQAALQFINMLRNEYWRHGIFKLTALRVEHSPSCAQPTCRVQSQGHRYAESAGYSSTGTRPIERLIWFAHQISQESRRRFCCVLVRLAADSVCLDYGIFVSQAGEVPLFDMTASIAMYHIRFLGIFDCVG